MASSLSISARAPLEKSQLTFFQAAVLVEAMLESSTTLEMEQVYDGAAMAYRIRSDAGAEGWNGLVATQSFTAALAVAVEHLTGQAEYTPASLQGFAVVGFHWHLFLRPGGRPETAGGGRSLGLRYRDRAGRWRSDGGRYASAPDLGDVYTTRQGRVVEAELNKRGRIVGRPVASRPAVDSFAREFVQLWSSLVGVKRTALNISHRTGV